MSGQGSGSGLYETVSQAAASAATTAQQYASSLTGSTNSGASTLPVREQAPMTGTKPAAGVPETVADSERRAGWEPEAAANPEAVREKSALEAELARTVPRDDGTSTSGISGGPVGLDGVAGDKSHSIDDSQHGAGSIVGLTGANAATTTDVPNGKISSEPYPYTMPTAAGKTESDLGSSATRTNGLDGAENVGNYSLAQGGDDRLHPTGTEPYSTGAAGTFDNNPQPTGTQHFSTAAAGALAPTEGVQEVKNDRNPLGHGAEDVQAERAARSGSAVGDIDAKKNVTSDTGDAPNDVKRNLKEIDDSDPKDKPTEAPAKSDKPASDREAAHRTNEDAIPTAGGKKIGEAHFGESKQVPDVPERKADDPGSKITNNEQEVPGKGGDEAEKNAGSSSSGSGSKLGNVLHKVEDKLHIGKH